MIYLYCTTCQTTHPLTADTCPTCGASLARAPLIRATPRPCHFDRREKSHTLTIFRLIRLIAHLIR